MRITWFGTATILIESGSHAVLFDPYLNLLNPVLPRVDLSALSAAEAIFITHPHMDHFMDIPAVLREVHAPVYICLRDVEIAKRQGFPMDTVHAIRVGKQEAIVPIRITALQGQHVRFDQAEVRQTLCRTIRRDFCKACRIGSYHHKFSIGKKDILCYLMEAEGKRILLMGSAALPADFTVPPDIDLLIYPYQGRSDLCAYSMQIIQELAPKRIILDHFDDAFPPISSAVPTDEFVTACKSQFEITVTVPREGIPVEV